MQLDRAAQGPAMPCAPHLSTELRADAKAHRQGQGARGQSKNSAKPATGRHQHHARDLRTALAWLKSQGDLIETDKDGRSRPRSHRPAEAHGWRLPGDVQQRQGQAQSPRHHQPVRRHERHQQDVRLDERRRARAQARRRRCASRSSRRSSSRARRRCRSTSSRTRRT